MNDFTKEEMEEILLGMRHFYVAYYNGFIPEEKSKISSGWGILNKLQSMIDNYCEHEDFRSCFYCEDCKVTERRCNQCGHIWYEGIE